MLDTQVIEHMSKRMALLPHGIQSGLKLSACLGSIFSANTLQKGIPDKGIDTTEFLRFAVEVSFSCSNLLFRTIGCFPSN